MLSRSVRKRFHLGSASFVDRCTQNAVRTPLAVPSNARFLSTRRLPSLWEAACSLSTEDERASTSPFFQQQVRWKRKGGASAFDKPRPPTRKQRKIFNRRKGTLHHEKEGKHSAPGSKAGYRRQFNEETWQDLLDHDKRDPEWEQQKLEYDVGDAIVDDLMGNTSTFTSIPTPRPIFLGHKHDVYYNRVREKMTLYRQAMQQLQDKTNGEPTSEITTSLPELPTDHDISLVLRAYRDRHGTKTKPIGTVKALKHLLTDLSLPISAFGEETYTTLVTCCRTPAEARRIFRLQKEQQHVISAYSWAILVDIHAKLGDFEGCDAVMNEMAAEGVLPTLPAYTSLMAACYKVCNNGTIPHAIRDKAGKLGWSRWKEMRIMGVDPDTMAYGALLRLVAARGQPERAINILQEMQSMEVKPTTLCFSSALKAVARSHQTAVRFERGSSKKNRRREQITAHHGKLARTIVILAESAEVEQDDGFVAALMLCAGAAGDSATAKAILLASEVRRLDALRTIGPDEHLRRLQGRVDEAAYSSLGSRDSLGLEHSGTGEIVSRDSGGALVHSSRKEKHYPTSFEEREYGKDTRKLSALLFACSQAADSNGLGQQWAGRGSKGYLCESSLRLLTVRPQPKYFNPAIPGVSSTEVGMGAIDWRDEDTEHLSKSLRRAKYRGPRQDDSAGYTMDDIDEQFYNMFKDDYKGHGENDRLADGMLMNKAAWDATNQIKMLRAAHQRLQDAPEEQAVQTKEASYQEQIEEASYQEQSSKEEWYFDDDVMRWKTRQRVIGNGSEASSDGGLKVRSLSKDGDEVLQEKGEIPTKDQPTEDFKEVDVMHQEQSSQEQWYFDDDVMRWKTRQRVIGNVSEASSTDDLKVKALSKNDRKVLQKKSESPIEAQVTEGNDEEEWYFDDDVMRWKTRPKVREQSNATMDFTDQTMKGTSAAENTSEEEKFQEFFSEMKGVINETGGDVEFSEEEAREMFSLVEPDTITTDPNAKDSGEDDDSSDDDSSDDDEYEDYIPRDFETFYAEIKEEWDVTEADAREMYDSIEKGRKDSDNSEARVGDVSAEDPASTNQALPAARNQENCDVQSEETSVDTFEDEPNTKLAILQEALPGLPRSRAKKAIEVFEKNLGYPSMLELVPILRENMPDHVTSGWLKRRNVQNAKYALQKAEEEKSMDSHILNGALQVLTSAGSLDGALAYHEDEFNKHRLTPTAYSDRLVLQMLIRNNRLPRALAFKQKVKESGRNLDLISYGSLIEYYGNHGKLGSAMLVLKECLAVHSAPPGGQSLKKLRLLCRQHDLEATVKLEELIGKDPMEWLREGEANLKREMSYKGRRNVRLPGNILVRG